MPPSPAGTSAKGRSPRALRQLERLWLALLFFVGLGYVALIPPFQSVDEVWHWDRAWTVAQGQYNCWRLPLAAGQFASSTLQVDRDPQKQPFPWSTFQSLREFVGSPGSFFVATAACSYPPTGYLPAALAIRLWALGEPEKPAPHRMFNALYGGRLANWLFFFACVLAAYGLSRYPLPVLMFASIPMVVHQSVSINNDAFLAGGIVLTCALLTSYSRARIAGALLLITLMSTVKPLCMAAATLAWVSLWSARERHKRGELVALAVLSVGLPVAAWLTWQNTLHLPILGMSTGQPIANVDPDAQIALLKAEPLRVFRVLYWQARQFFFSPWPMEGSYAGLLLVLGWCRFRVPDLLYAMEIAALVAGALSLREGARREADDVRPPRVLLLGVIAGALAYSAAATLVLYAVFTPLAAEMVLGVQARYHHYPLCMLLFVPLLASARAKLVPPNMQRIAAFAFLGLSLTANLYALSFMRGFWWEP